MSSRFRGRPCLKEYGAELWRRIGNRSLAFTCNMCTQRGKMREREKRRGRWRGRRRGRWERERESKLLQLDSKMIDDR